MPSPEFEAVVQLLRDNPVIPPDVSVEEMRASMEAMTARAPLPEGSSAEPLELEGIPAEWVAAQGASRDAAVLYLHGGGYGIGSISTHRNLAAAVSDAAGVRCLLIDYRLAPENPFPAAVEDACRAYRWMLSQGLDPARLAIAGDSAGGGLTAATLVALREAGDPLPAAGVCLSPWVDLACVGESWTSKADVDPMVQREGLMRMAGWYLADTDPREPLASPVYANLSGLPPLLIQVGTSETLLDDARNLAESARAAGVEATLEEWQEMVHVFQAFVGVIPEAAAAVDRIGEFLRAKLG
jgi:monoterpene epsilon-lactone hydrolase